jgi:hypothetical protein
MHTMRHFYEKSHVQKLREAFFMRIKYDNYDLAGQATTRKLSVDIGTLKRPTKITAPNFIQEAIYDSVGNLIQKNYPRCFGKTIS